MLQRALRNASLVALSQQLLRVAALISFSVLIGLVLIACCSAYSVLQRVLHFAALFCVLQRLLRDAALKANRSAYCVAALIA